MVNKGKETDDAFTIDRLGDLAQRLPILVLNDEGHHCWRPAPGANDAEKTKGLTAEEKKALEEDAEEARIWLLGLDRINNSGLAGKATPGILAAIDMSATPFYLGNSGYPEGSPFPWLVSDFGLVDAIECGIVKIPRLPVLDDQSKIDEVGRPDPKYFRLWKKIVEGLSTGDKGSNKRPKPEAVYREAQSALVTIAGQWKGFEEILAKYAQSASTEFRSARFQAASGGSASASMAAAKLYNKDGSFFGDVVGTLGENVVVSLPTGVRATISLSQAAEMMAPQGATPPSPPPPPDLAIGMKLVTSDGRAFGTISSIEGDAVRVSLALGGSITITRAQAKERKPQAP